MARYRYVGFSNASWLLGGNYDGNATAGIGEPTVSELYVRYPKDWCAIQDEVTFYRCLSRRYTTYAYDNVYPSNQVGKNKFKDVLYYVHNRPDDWELVSPGETSIHITAGELDSLLTLSQKLSQMCDYDILEDETYMSLSKKLLKYGNG